MHLCRWRRDRDSNPGWAQTHNGFRDRPVRPLRHLSALGVMGVPCSGRARAVQGGICDGGRRRAPADATAPIGKAAKAA